MQLIKAPRNSNLVLLFFLLFSLANIHSQPISTIGEIYDYDVGDVFHFKHSLGYANNMTAFVSYRNIEVTDKFIISSEKICYNRSIKKQEKWENEIIWTFIDTTDSICYSELDSLINGGDIDTVYTSSPMYNGRIINSRNFYAGSEQTNFDYVNGCGLAVYSIFDWASTYFWENILVHYKKGTETWGTPVYVSLKERDFNDNEICLYPNPAIDNIIIECQKQGNAIAEIYSVNGTLLKRIKTKDESTTINVSDLQKGVYILVVYNNRERIYRKLIKE